MRIIVDTATDTPTLVHHALSLIEDLLTAGAFGGTASTFNAAELAPFTVAPPAPPAFVPPVTPAASLPPATADRDGQGTPWDERIHSSSKSTTDAGTWRRKKNITDEFYNTVMAELHPAQPGVVQTAPMPPAPSIVQPTVTPPPGAPLPPAAPLAPVQPAASGAVVEWPEICTLMNERLSPGRITPEYLSTLGTKYLGKNMPFALIATRPDLYASIKAEFLAV